MAARVHHIFQSLGLRHLAVVEPRGFVVGIITRKDLDIASTGTCSVDVYSLTFWEALFCALLPEDDDGLIYHGQTCKDSVKSLPFSNIVNHVQRSSSAKRLATCEACLLPHCLTAARCEA